MMVPPEIEQMDQSRGSNVKLINPVVQNMDESKVELNKNNYNSNRIDSMVDFERNLEEIGQ